MLVHMFDKQGLLNTRLVKWGRPGGGEFYSGSIIRTAKAFVWGGGDISGGFVLAPSTQILCAYDHDQGTDGQANGGCPIDHEWSGDDLLAVLEAGAPQTAYWINEIIVGGAAWERSLPGGVEAFFTSGGRGADQLRAAHRAFLEEHGLCASQACRGFGGLKEEPRYVSRTMRGIRLLRAAGSSAALHGCRSRGCLRRHLAAPTARLALPALAAASVRRGPFPGALVQ